MKDMSNLPCPECTSVDRRDFVRTLAVGGAALAAGGGMLAPRIAKAGERLPMPRVVNTAAEDLVKELFAGLDDKQKKAVVKPWDHPARKSVNPNKALDKTIGTVYTKTQQESADEDCPGHRVRRPGLGSDQPEGHLGSKPIVRQMRRRHFRRPLEGQIRV